MKQQRIFVNGIPFSIVERPGYLRADMRGFLGWGAVWVNTNRHSGEPGVYVDLVRRIKQALRGGQ